MELTSNRVFNPKLVQRLHLVNDACRKLKAMGYKIIDQNFSIHEPNPMVLIDPEEIGVDVLTKEFGPVEKNLIGMNYIFFNDVQVLWWNLKHI